MNASILDENSRVWVYQSNRVLNDAEVSEINKMAQHFVTGWDAHGAMLSSAIKVYYNLFIVIFVDENVTQISGCAIDKSVAFIKKVEAQLNINLFDRMAVAFQQNNRVEITSIAQLQELINQGKVTDETLVFNNLIGTKKEFDHNWLIPLHKSWHKRMLSMV